MLTSRLIPCLDVRDGAVVKGVRFAGLRRAGDPLDLARRYQDQGADELAVLDVSATPEGRGHGLGLLERLREALSLPLLAGGGVRSAADAERLLASGADKVAVNTAAVESPGLLDELAVRFGSQCTVLALDAAGDGTGWSVVTRSGRRRTERDAVAWAAEAERRGAGEILLTSWDRDGTRAGYDLELIGAVAGAVGVPIIASGGAARAGHLLEALRAGACAVLAASILHDGEHTVRGLKAELRREGVEVRL